MEKYICLNEFISVLTGRSGIHVCVHDVSGILHRPDLELEYDYRIHSKSYCNTVKLSREGYDTCMRCKTLCNRRAVRNKEPFAGHCPFGLLEAVQPVVVDSRTVAIIYVGGVRDGDSLGRAKSHNRPELYALLDECPTAEVGELMRIASAVDSYIRFILSAAPVKDSGAHRYPVSDIKERIQSEYKKPLSLKEMSELYFFNEKYLGRLFMSETGMTFHEYLNKIRTERARALLETSDLPILDIAFDCGFGSVSYFNRVFKRTVGVTPSEYRKSIGII